MGKMKLMDIIFITVCSFCHSSYQISMKHRNADESEALVIFRRSHELSLPNHTAEEPGISYNLSVITSPNWTKSHSLKAQSRKFDGVDYPILMFSGGDHITTLQLSGDVLSGESSVKENVLINGLHGVKFLDYFSDLNNRYIFWTDSKEKKIYKAAYAKSGLENITDIISNGLGEIQGLAVDWIGRHIYWLDGQFKKIEVALLNGNMRAILVAYVSYPRGLTIDPFARLLIWADLNSERPVIEKCDMSGTSRTAVLELMKYEESDWPSAMTVDYAQQLIFWVGAKSGTILKTDYYGNNVEKVYNSGRFRSPISIDLFSDTLLWSDHFRSSILAFNRKTKEATTISVVFPELYALKVLHSSQLVGNLSSTNPCLKDSGNCSHICILANSVRTVCACPYGLVLAQDNRTCKSISEVVMYWVDERTSILKVNSVQNPMAEMFPSFSFGKKIDYGILAWEHFYWISEQNIQKLDLKTGRSSIVLHLAHLFPKIIVAEHKGGCLYVMSAVNNSKSELSVCSRNGEYFNPLHWLDMNEPEALTVDSDNRLIFWSHSYQLHPEQAHCIIEFSQLDGSLRKFLLGYYASSNEHCPKSMVTLSSIHMLCWLQNGDIKCVNFSGDSSKIKFSLSSSFGYITGMTNHFNEIYYMIEDGKTYHTNISSNAFSSNYVMKFKQGSQIFGVTALSSDKGSYWNSKRNHSFACLPYPTAAAISCPLIRGIDKFLITSTDNGLQTVPLEPKNILPIIFPFPIFATSIESFEYDPSRNTLYYIYSKSSGIFSSRRDGKNNHYVIPAVENVTSFAVDLIAENIYWTSANSRSIKMSRTNGKYPVVLINHEVGKPVKIAVDPKNGYLFWNECCTKISIQTSTLSGMEKRTLAAENILHVNDLAIDSEWLFLYWADQLSGTLERIKYDGKERQLLVSSSYPFSVDIGSTFFYWSERNAEVVSIYFSHKKKIQKTLLKGNLTGNVRKLHFLDTRIDLDNNLCSQGNGGCEQLCFFDGKSNVTCGCSNSILNPDGKTCSSHKSFLLMAHGNHIESFSLQNPFDANSPMPHLSPSPKVKNTLAVAADTYSQRIFFSDLHHPPYLFSMDFHGQNLQPLLNDEKLREIDSLAYNNLDGFLYWTDSISPSVCRMYVARKAENNQKNEVESIINLDVADKPRGIALDQCSSMIFWTNWLERSPSIECAFLNGSSREMIISSGLNRPNGLSVESRLKKLFWADAKYDGSYSLYVANLDGTYIYAVARGINQHPYDVAVYGNFLFWTDWKNGSLMVTDWVSGKGSYVIRSGYLRPMGLAVVEDNSVECFSNESAIDDSIISCNFYEKYCNQSYLRETNRNSGYPFLSAVTVGVFVAVLLFSFSALLILKKCTTWRCFRSRFSSVFTSVRDINQENLTSPLFDEAYHGHQQLVVVSPHVKNCTSNDRKFAVDTNV